MRLMSLATLIIVGFCLVYAHHVEPVVLQSSSYDGPATFVSLNCNDEVDSPARWLLVCQVDGDRVAFSANDAWVRRAAGPLHPGQAVTLHYDLPAKSRPGGYSELGAPALRGITPTDAGGRRGALALGTTAAVH